MVYNFIVNLEQLFLVYNFIVSWNNCSFFIVSLEQLFLVYNKIVPPM
jgi:hypothetical protein